MRQGERAATGGGFGGSALVLGIAGLVLPFVLSGCAVLGRPAEGLPAQDRHVRYEVFGDGDVVDVTYTSDGGTGTEQLQNVPLPFRKEISLEEAAFQVFTLSAQNADEGRITCRITVDGEVLDESSSVGAWELALCNDSAP
ncbi:MmpS family membrane protein [Saccharopolyspora erythraea NRRL 2338]|uniref:Uncharacterized protein n=2 Tax=Saccharopolyspora erythraea TaxID=1836 RepID=A4FM01_SACEN|nr:MmpS family transport accessory protein [Saccharopolyspora erythraea]EQD88264.1 hypothetical protein N599_00530 [Saccharopolyspora erythraea D]PFG98714.1 MmpS family membrane protein [Saccharopolyspora erythraea NRRL 2338]QRK88724.1 hypothetical protein JQX30_29515 [Saccharopolyspora erythraea]CAM05076.1 hypothetical protein SACE_5893 [Saccharopolyspora erythraea NRRL 2338]